MSRFSSVGGVLAVGLMLSIVAPFVGATTPLVLAQQNQQKRQVVITELSTDMGGWSL